MRNVTSYVSTRHASHGVTRVLWPSLDILVTARHGSLFIWSHHGTRSNSQHVSHGTARFFHTTWTYSELLEFRLLKYRTQKIRYIFSEEGSNASSLHTSSIPHIIYLHFQSPNYRSEPFILFSILICAWRPNFTFFWIFLLFFKIGTKSLFFERSRYSDFVPILKNSKKIQKNVKFGLQAHINMENKMNGSDR